MESLSAIQKTIFANIPGEANEGTKDGLDQLVNSTKNNANICNFAIPLLSAHDKIKNDLLYIKDGSSKVILLLQETLAFIDFQDRCRFLMFKAASLTSVFFEQERSLIIWANTSSANTCSISVLVECLLFVGGYHVMQVGHLYHNQHQGAPDFIYYTRTVDRAVLLTLSFLTVKTDIIHLLEGFPPVGTHQGHAHEAGHRTQRRGESRKRPCAAGKVVGVDMFFVTAIVMLLIGLLL